MEGYFKLALLTIIAASLVTVTTQLQRKHHRRPRQGFDPCENAEQGEYVRGPINCSHYIYCDDNNAYDEFCGNGMYFDPDTQDCGDPADVDCDDDSGYYDSDEYEDNDSEEYEDEDSEYEDTEESYEDSEESGECPRTDNPGEVIFIPSSESCSEYFVCYHGTSIAMHCASNLHFNNVTKRCDFPRNANCKLETPYFPTTHPRCDKDTVIEVYPHPTQCDYYYYCRKGYLSIQQCPFYYYFDAATKTCQFRDGFQCIRRYSRSRRLLG